MPETRITGGEWLGRVVRTPRGAVIRPTRAMVRQALFNVLGDRVVDALFLDLFAGAGTVGFEALSRGARSATFVERDAEQARLISSNAERFGCADRCRVVRADAARWLREHSADAAGVDVCFVDAPYAEHALDTVLARLGGDPPRLVVCEHHRARSLPEHIGGLRRVRDLNHGLTTLTFLQPDNGTMQQ
ncbi:MAG TPA: 16S rRNA (guanine(966)-N(2))-methyltransferase RsmD [Candidatus Dormibacteraeota bacterium]|nr:16S rRNA (guanine(966)-N(2))-methyltransferase RsmD [Candidatus Dormibacteraeota bacterium]